jgi:hypothetical protein
MRQIVRASLPLGTGIVLDPFMGAGSTIAAAQAVGYASIGVEHDPVYFAMAREAIPALARLKPNGTFLDHGPVNRKGAVAAKKSRAGSARRSSLWRSELLIS